MKVTSEVNVMKKMWEISCNIWKNENLIFKVLYKFDMFGELFVVPQHWCKGIMYEYASRCLLRQM